MERFRFATDPSGDLAGMLAGPQFEGGDITVDGDVVRVTLGDPPAFSTTIPRSSIRSAARAPALRGATRGIHGRRGRWLVNRSADGLVRMRLDPPVRASISVDIGRIEGAKIPKNRLVRRLVLRLLDREIDLRELTIGVEDPDAFVRAIAPR